MAIVRRVFVIGVVADIEEIIARMEKMPKAIRLYVRYVEAVSRTVGWFAMLIALGMMGLLLFGSISRAVFNSPYIWVVEAAQFTMAAYYLLGGGYSMILDGHVRMDLVYGRLSSRARAILDSITVLFLIFYLVLLLIGGLFAVDYAVKYNQVNFTPWGPPLAPIKIVMVIGIALMLLQAIATFFKDLATALGKAI